MTRCESYPPCFGTIYFPTAPFSTMRYMRFACFRALKKINIPEVFLRRLIHGERLGRERGVRLLPGRR